MNHSTVRFTPDQRYRAGLLAPIAALLVNCVRYRELLGQLVRREIVVNYKRSLIGIGWIVVTPLLGILSWVFLQATAVLQPGDVGIPYPAYVLIGSTIWGFFIGSVAAVGGTLFASRGFMMHTSFPHEVLFGVQLAVKAIYFGLSLLLSLLVLSGFGVMPSVRGLLLFPLTLLPLIFLSSSIGLIVAMVAVVSYDLERLITSALALLLYVSPVIYSVQGIRNAALRTVVLLNPLTYLVGGARDVLLYGHPPAGHGFWLSAGFSLVFFVIVWRSFYLRERALLERMI
jgi:lipopolysaccharide transport system permease protein